MAWKQKLLQYAVTHSDRLSQALNRETLDTPWDNAAMSACCREAAAEGIVLLKNEGMLPLSAARETAFFGRVQNDYFYVGYGSGGDVNAPYKRSPMDAVRSRGICHNEALAEQYRSWSRKNVPFEGVWGMWPTYFEEMPLSAGQVRVAAQTSRNAVVFIGRAMGESMDSKAKKGFYELTDGERKLLALVTTEFEQTCVVVNTGSILDLSWVQEYNIHALLLAFQGGMESGNAVIDVLYGEAEPSGRLTDTVALRYTDYPASQNFGHAHHNFYREDIYVGYRYFETFAPERVLYPFGFGLSYTDFDIQTQYREDGKSIFLTASVTNTGTRPGAQVVQVYVQPPQGKLGKPVRNLVAFVKTKLLQPGETQELTFAVPVKEFASYDDSGITGHRYCYVLEPGSYTLYCGCNVRDAAAAGVWHLVELRVTRELTSQAAPEKPFRRLKPQSGSQGRLVASYEKVPLRATSLRDDILAHLPPETPYTGDLGISYEDVRSGKASLDAFVAQLDITEMDAITRGEGSMHSPFGADGNAGMLGGTIDSLRKKGVPTVITTDGPSGIRLSARTSLLPCGTALACSWNTALVERLGTLFGKEMAQTGSDILLGPGMNIHRDPLCGRNFEYFSEDPLLTGKLAAAMVRGIQSVPGRSACPKHFACNNQEWQRLWNDSRLSERALREIYLRGFEICVKESSPLTIMTCYNKINGVWGHYHYALVTNILRGEWGFEGLVITDWWMRPSRDPDFPALTNNAYRVRAQVDVLMPGSCAHGKHEGDVSLRTSYNNPNGITLGEMQRCAKNVLKFCIKLGK